MIPQLPAVAHFVKLSNPHAEFVRRGMLRHNIHGHLAKGNTNIYIGADVAQYLESAAVYEPAKFEVLTLAWEFDEYVISLTIYDSSTKKDTGEIYPYVNGAIYHTYFTREGWDYVLAGDYMYGENVIDQIYPEGLVLPAK